MSLRTSMEMKQGLDSILIVSLLYYYYLPLLYYYSYIVKKISLNYTLQTKVYLFKLGIAGKVNPVFLHRKVSLFGGNFYLELVFLQSLLKVYC